MNEYEFNLAGHKKLALEILKGTDDIPTQAKIDYIASKIDGVEVEVKNNTLNEMTKTEQSLYRGMFEGVKRSREVQKDVVIYKVPKVAVIALGLEDHV